MTSNETFQNNFKMDSAFINGYGFAKKLTAKLLEISANYPQITWELEDALSAAIVAGSSKRQVVALVRSMI